MHIEKQKILKELETLAAKKVRADRDLMEKWVEFAENPATHSHAVFEWDDLEAVTPPISAEILRILLSCYRAHLEQVSDYLHGVVKVIPQPNENPVRAYVPTTKVPENG